MWKNLVESLPRRVEAVIAAKFRRPNTFVYIVYRGLCTAISHSSTGEMYGGLCTAKWGSVVMSVVLDCDRMGLEIGSVSERTEG